MNKRFNLIPKKDIFKINKLIEKHKNVFLFGAHIFSQMILFNGLDKRKVIGILDNDKQKSGKYLYGTNLKIKNPLTLKKINEPCVVLRAGSYNQEIKKQLLEINKKVTIV